MENKKKKEVKGSGREGYREERERKGERGSAAEE